MWILITFWNERIKHRRGAHWTAHASTRQPPNTGREPTTSSSQSQHISPALAGYKRKCCYNNQYQSINQPTVVLTSKGEGSRSDNQRSIAVDWRLTSIPHTASSSRSPLSSTTAKQHTGQRAHFPCAPLSAPLSTKAPPYKRTLHVRLTHCNYISHSEILYICWSNNKYAEWKYCVISCKRNPTSIHHRQYIWLYGNNGPFRE